MKRFVNLGLAAVLVAVFLLAACQAPPVQPSGPVQVEVINAADFAPLAGNFGDVSTRSAGRGGLLCANESGPCVESWNGSDIVTYSDAGDTQTFSVDGATGAVQYGSLDAFPVGNTTSGKLYEFGATGAITSAAVTPVAITTVTAYGCQVVNPVIAAWHCGVKIGASNNITLTVYNLAATPVATPRAATFWVAGN